MAAHLKQKAKRVSARRIFKPSVKSRRKHAVRVGDVIISWNELQTALLLLFCMTINKGGNPDLATRIWMAIKSDSGQRDVLRATIEANLTNDKEVQKRALWAITVADKLSGIRNDFTHVSISYNTTNPNDWSVVPSPLAVPKGRTKRLSTADLGKIQSLLCGDLRTVSAFVLLLAYHVIGKTIRPDMRDVVQPQPLPKIPRLKIHSVFPELKSALRYLPTTKARGAQQKASRR